jgi:hypothetical protein
VSVIRELDTVKLLKPVERWPAGSVGAVVDAQDGYVTVEISPEVPGVDETDLMDVLVDVAEKDVRVIERPGRR